MTLECVINGSIERDKGVGKDKEECTCNGQSLCERPAVLPTEVVGDLRLSPPIAPRDGSEKKFVFGKLEGDLLNRFQHCCGICLGFLIYGSRPVINISKTHGHLRALVFSHRFLLQKMGAYDLFACVEWAFDFRCTSVHFPSLIGTFDTLKVIEVFPDELIEHLRR